MKKTNAGRLLWPMALGIGLAASIVSAGDSGFTDANWVSLNPGIPGVGGPVYAMVADANGNVYVGASAYTGTGWANNIAKWDGSRWWPLGEGVDGTVFALALSGTNLYAAGNFTMAGGVPANNIARWDGQAWSPLGEGVGGSYDAEVLALAVIGTDLYVGGNFTTAGGVTANAIAKWDGGAWSALGEGFTAPAGWEACVAALAVEGNTLYAGGWRAIHGFVAKWDGAVWATLGSTTSGEPGEVRALAVSGTSLYAGGYFMSMGGVTAFDIAKWDGAAWSGLGSGGVGGGGWVNALAVSGTDLYVGGWFYSAYGPPTDNIAKWDGSAWSALGSGTSGEGYTMGSVQALAVSGTNLYVGGDFPVAGGLPVNYIAKWDSGAWSSLGQGMDNYVESLAVSGTSLYAGGCFSSAGTGLANRIAKWDGSTWSPLGWGINPYDVLALAASGTNLYAGTDYVPLLQKWDGFSWADLGLSGYYADNFYVSALAVNGTDLYAGGNFYQAGGLSAGCIAKWDGSSWSPLGAGILWESYDTSVRALAVSGTDLYAGGSFTTAGGNPANNVARWDGSAWSALGSGMTGADEYTGVYALAALGTNLYAGGWFTNAGGVAANYIAKWDGRAWSPLGSGITGADEYTCVYALAVDGNDLYVGGWFTNAGGVAANCIAKWDGSKWSALGSGMDGYVSSLATDGAGHLYVGGGFFHAGTSLSPFIAQANLPPAALSPLEILQGVLAEIVAQRATATDPKDVQRLDQALVPLRASLAAGWWVDPTHITAGNGNQVFNQDKECVKKLLLVLKGKSSALSQSVVLDWMDRIVAADRLLAWTCLDEAAQAGLDQQRLAEDMGQLARGDEAAAAGNPDNAIQFYWNAWRHGAQLSP